MLLSLLIGVFLQSVDGFSNTLTTRICETRRRMPHRAPKRGSSSSSSPCNKPLWASTYLPPDVSIDEEDDDNNYDKTNPAGKTKRTPSSPSKMSMASSVTKVDGDESYFETSSSSSTATPRRRPIIRNKTPSTTQMAGTNWMEKNVQFGKQVGLEITLEQQKQEFQERNKDYNDMAPPAAAGGATKRGLSSVTAISSSSSKPPPRRVVLRREDNDNVTNKPPPRRISTQERSTFDRPSPQRSSSSSSYTTTPVTPNQTFRQDFRKTRVFVQGIPDGTSWQDLKDHFRQAGQVVFASVSVDAQTGASKGHGIVQFETTEMAQQAIEMMRNYPLFGTHPLFVREDVQEGSGTAVLSQRPMSPRQQQERERVGSTSSPPSIWKCANDDNTEHLADKDRTSIRTLIKARDDARRRKAYAVSDTLREELKDKYGVFLDDRLKLWWTSADGKKVPRAIQDIKGEDGKWDFKGPSQPWRYIPTTMEQDASVNRDLVNGLLQQRDVARREKDFSTADALLQQARESPDGDLTLRIHDESRTWRVWTEEPPPAFAAASSRKEKTPSLDDPRWQLIEDDRLSSRSNSRNSGGYSEVEEEYEEEDDEDDFDDDEDFDEEEEISFEEEERISSSNRKDSKDPMELRRQQAAEQCLEILRQHNPGKVTEIQALLNKFPGREFGILEKLQQTYGK
jgi:hypothetical protein